MNARPVTLRGLAVGLACLALALGLSALLAPAGVSGRVPASEPLRLDLNCASVAELAGLPGIGPVLAQRIVARREERGGFASAGELLAVRGIGPRKLSRLLDKVAVEGRPGGPRVPQPQGRGR